MECTYNRVGEQFFDQLTRSGHDRRLDDLDRIADLGIRRLRYPALWERAATDVAGSYDWTWSDTRLTRLQQLQIDPIIGFLHHGSGPVSVNLLSDDLPSGLEHYAAAFAQRFPWVEYYTPVNEPLTTARFSGLYGHWYPHKSDAGSFASACLNQYRATVLAMQAIRCVRDDAKLALKQAYSKPVLRDRGERSGGGSRSRRELAAVVMGQEAVPFGVGR